MLQGKTPEGCGGREAAGEGRLTGSGGCGGGPRREARLVAAHLSVNNALIT